MVYGAPSYGIDEIGRYRDAGCEGMSSAPTKPHHFERIEADVLAAFA